jgi:anti-anti-sigma factor
MSRNIGRIRRHAEAIIVEVSGQVDLKHQPEFQRALLAICEERPARLALLLASVDYMDSSGVGTLVKISQTLRKTNGKLVLVGPTDRVMSIFQITTLDRYFNIVKTEDEALAL